MAATLLTASAGQGKTQAVIAKVKSLLQRKLFGKVWVLLPTDLQISVFRTRLLDEIGDAAHFGVEFFGFYDLYTRLLEIGGKPQRLVQDAARFRILRHVLDDIGSDGLVHFHNIMYTAGFVALVAEFIKELKQAEINPDNFKVVAQTPKDYDLATIYQGYQNFLRSGNLVDREGEGWLALATLQEQSDLPLNLDLLVVDGYDQFNPVQARLLTLLAQQVPNTLLTLTYQPERAETAHRRFAQTRSRLLESGVWTESALKLSPVVGNPVLHHISSRLFDIQIEAVDNDGSLAMIEAPSREREVQTVLRRVKRLLHSGVDPEQILIVARNLEAYTPYFLETAPAYGIPLAPRRGSPLSNNPLVASILSLIDLPQAQFPRRQVIDALRSPYLQCPYLTTEQIDALDRISRGRIVVRGRLQWLDGITAAGQLKEDAEGDIPFDAISPDDSVVLRESVDLFFARITPAPIASAPDYVSWFENLIGLIETATDHFNVLERVNDTSEREIMGRDLIALDCLNRLLGEVLSAYELVDPYARISWENFRAELQIAIDNTTINTMRTANRLGRVLLTSVYEARGLAHDHVFMLGLSEGEFPAQAGEDALYIDEERRQMQAHNIPLLTRAEAADESSLFYEMSALARQSLTLSRPYVDEKGNPWPASPYWRAVQALVQVECEHLPIAAALNLTEAARVSETMIALAQGLTQRASPELIGVHQWLLTHEKAASWQNAIRAHRVESRRTSAVTPHDAYTGRLTDPVLLEMVAQTLGPNRLWSASQFNEYGICPYRFFAKRLLALETLEEPEEGIDQLQLGSLLHKILEHTYRRIAFLNLTIHPDNQKAALDILQEIMDHFFPTAPQDYGFRATSLWLQEQETHRRKLKALVATDFSEDSPIRSLFKDLAADQRQSIRQEVQFGYEGQKAILIDGPAGPLRVRGAIDRVDEVFGWIVVIDYKTGAKRIPIDELLGGRNVQMMLYTQAAHQILGEQTGIKGTFWHISSNAISGQLDAEDNKAEIETANEELHYRIMAGRQGIFTNTPSKRTSDGHCTDYCEFRQLCRVDRVSSRKTVDQQDQQT
jgi:ATP-dependent helicase/nuclease subunit B